MLRTIIKGPSCESIIKYVVCYVPLFEAKRLSHLATTPKMSDRFQRFGTETSNAVKYVYK